MKRFFPIRRSTSTNSGIEQGDSAEAIISRELTAFCESDSNSTSNGASRDAQGTEFIHLPKIVETAESSPNAAKEAALRIRKYLADPAGTPNHTQYNAIMLMRILADNPGHTFTRNFDAKFVTTIKELLRTGRDWYVQSYLRQYLDTLEQQRGWDEDLKLLLQMWAKEKSKGSRGLVGNNTLVPFMGSRPLLTRAQIDRFPMASITAPPMHPTHPNNQRPPQPPPRALPDPVELAARIEEARNSAKLLTQFVQSTPPLELEDNDLIKEFVDRCRTGSRVVQSYIHASNPAPDEDTLLTLIETNDEISVALSQQQRAMLKARKIRGSSSPSSSNVNSPSPTSQVVSSGSGNHAAPRPSARSPEPPAGVPELPSTVMTGGRGHASNNATATGSSSRYEYKAEDFQVRNPFADDYATNDSDQETSRVQPTEQKR
ncbi:uncharacterized protein N7515_007259 [Penicillium bovifimosum]|uniref:GAT domain-containing protein n=1 Tax=Penicillium bovifimosum TaxID=126998 RepID=A0A9W9GW91_9EURO|nr:uncharacterized protein N7515_007259 [Penicillium bovifimosum]KAJ5131220.1 hypothetical protein N7515_007259 [Penicillium bovifimosum]